MRKSQTKKHVSNWKKHEVYIFESNYFLTDKRHELTLLKRYKPQAYSIQYCIWRELTQTKTTFFIKKYIFSEMLVSRKIKNWSPKKSYKHHIWLFGGQFPGLVFPRKVMPPILTTSFLTTEKRYILNTNIL